MSSVDDRIVNMQFNNKQFESGVSQSQRSLQGLEQSLANTAKSKGLTGLASSVDGVKNRFSAMQVAGVAAVATIASKATAMGINMVKSLTLSPITAGFQEYQTNLNSIQTIVSNTGKSVPQVNKALDQLNHYADQTIYNFSEMAHNIGTFTAAGVNLKTSVASIKGIANLAAMSGSSSQQASMAMYQLSQAIAAGKVGLQDWNSVVNAGMGGKVFQTALSRTGVNMGTLSKNAIQMVGPMKKLTVEGQSFRESISAKPGEKAWLTGEVLTETLKQISGGYSVAQLRAKHYSEDQIKDIEKLASQSFKAATQIKTLPQLFGVVQESIGSMWSSTFRAILGDFDQSKDLWGKVGDKLVGPFGIITQMSNNFTGMMQNWADQGGRNQVINGFKNLFGALGDVLSQLKSAFREIFPPNSLNTLLSMSAGFEKLTTYLVPSSKTLEDLKSIFGGVFAVLHIGITIIKALAAGFGAFFGEIFKGSGQARGGFLDFLASIGEALINADKFLTSGGKMVDLFRNIGKAAGVVAGKGLEIASGIILGIASGMQGTLGEIQTVIFRIATQIVDWFKSALGIHSPATELVPVGTNIIAGIGEGIMSAVSAIGHIIGKVVGEVVGFFSNGFGNMDALDWATLMNTLFTGTLLLSMRSFFKAFGGIGNSIRQTFGQLTNTLSAMENKVKAEALKQIAIAVGILAASLIALSFIKPEKLAISVGAIASLMAILVGAMKAMGGIGAITDDAGNKVQKGGLQLMALSAAMVGMATAMAILSAAVALLGHQKPETLVRGIGALVFMMGIMVGSLFALSKAGPMAKGAGAAMLLMATAMDVLVGAVFALGKMDMDTLKQGIGGLAFTMGIMIATLNSFAATGKQALAGAAAIAIVTASMVALVGVIGALALMPMDSLKKGLGALAITLGLVIAALMILATNSVGVALVAQAMLLMSAAMVALAIAVGMFGGMSWGDLGKGFAAVAAGLTLLLVAAAAAIPLAPGLAALSGTFLALGQAMLWAGAGVLALSAGLAILAVVGAAGLAVLVVGAQAFLALLPALGVQLAAAFVSFVQTIAAASDKLRPAFATIFKNMVGVITDNIPVIGRLIQKLISTAIGIIRKSVPQWIEMGFTIIDKFIQSAAKHVPDMVDNALKLVTGFLNAIAKNIGQVVDSGVKLIISFINGVADAIDNNVADLRKAGLNLALAIINGMTGGLLNEGMKLVKNAVERLANSIPGPIRKILGIRSPSREAYYWGRMIGAGLSGGIYASIKMAVGATVAMANAVIAAGDASVARAQRNARAQQIAANAAQAQADVAKTVASKVDAKKNPKLAKKLKARADRAQEVADAAQARADAAAQSVQDAKDFAAADLVGKGDILSERAQGLSDQAARMLAKANAEAVAARKLMETNKKAGRAMLQQAQNDAKAARSLANQAQAANAQANSYYAQEVQKRLDDIQAEEDAKKEQAAYDAADTQGKLDILKKRADAAQAKADAKYAEAAALVDRAKALAATDAAGALRLLDQADALRQDAKDAADAAQQARDQAAQLVGQTTASSGTPGPGSTIEVSRSVLDNAASAVDSYTASMLAASEAAGATQQVVQFVQNNNSPVALTVSEVYRQTKNLLSAQEIKTGTSSN